MGVLDQLDDELEQGDAPSNPDRELSDRDTDVRDPFSLGYDFDGWEIDDRTVDRGLGIVIAVTNLL